MRLRFLLSCSLFMCSVGSVAARPAAPPASVLRHADAVLTARPLARNSNLLGLDRQVQRAVAALPNSAAAHRVLGRVYLNLARYGEAKDEFARALSLDPRDRLAKAGLQQAKRLAWVVRSLPLPRGQRVLCLAEVPGRRGRGFFVLSGAWDAGALRDPSVWYFEREPDRFHRVFQTRLDTSVQLGALTPPARGGVQFARAWVGDFQHTGRVQVWFLSGRTGTGWAPHFVDVFEMDNGRPRQVLHVDSHYAPERVDLNHDGRPEIRVSHGFGYEVPPAGQRRWYDLYAYHGRQYVRANFRYRHFGAWQLKQAREQFARYPRDWDVLAHLAQAYRDIAQPYRARLYQDRADTLRHTEERRIRASEGSTLPETK